MKKARWSKQIARFYGDTSGEQKSHYYTPKWHDNWLVSLCGHFLFDDESKVKTDKNPHVNQCKLCKKIFDKKHGGKS